MQLKAKCFSLALPRKQLTKTALLMNWTTIFLFAALLHASAGTYSQTISISEKNAPLKKVLKEISKQSGYTLWYEKALIEKSGNIDMDIKNATIDEALTACFKDKNLVYSIVGKMVAIKVKPQNPEPTALNKINVRGKVLNEKEEPLAGATIELKGGSRKVATDEKGEFYFPGLDAGAILVVSNIGYQSKDIRADDRELLIIRLFVTVSKLDDVQVIGYGETTERYATGSVSKIGSHEIGNEVISNPLAAIQARAPGVFVQTENGLPGGNIKVQIRGQNSISAGNAPLFVVDGIPFPGATMTIGYNPATGTSYGSPYSFVNGSVSPLNGIDPSEIESIEILKDADATAIYGSRGANGVVLIMTKKGRAGKTRLDLDISQGFSQLGRMADYLGLKDYLSVRREGFSNDGLTPTAQNAPDLLLWDTTKYTNWQKYLLGGTAPMTKAGISLSGGNEATRFLLGLNYLSQGTVMPGDQHYGKAGMHFSLEHTAGRLHALFTVNYVADNNELLKSPDIISISRLPPDYPVFNPDRSLNWYTVNPQAFLKQKASTRSENAVYNTVLEYRLFRGLYIKANLGYTRVSLDMHSTDPASSENPLYGVTSNAYFGENSSRTWLAEPQLEWKTKLGKGMLDMLAGGTYQQTMNSGYSIHGINYSSEELLDDLGSAGSISDKSGTSTEYKYISVFGRMGYSLKSRYLLSLNFRRDGSSRFGPDKQYGNFGSAGAGWIFSSEPFTRALLPFLSFGKLRASYGWAGNDQIPDYQYLSTYGSSLPYQDNAALAPQTLANSSYSWESTRKAECSIELGFIKDKILLNFSWYDNASSKLLVAYPLAAISGPFGSYQANFPGRVGNSGYEVELSTVNIKLGPLKWSGSFNISVNRNRLLSYPEIAQSSYANTLTIGKDLTDLKEYRYTGVDSATGKYGFLDLNADGTISYPRDYIAAGKTSPYFFGGLSNDFTLGHFSFGLLFQFVRQFSYVNYATNYVPYGLGNYYSVVLDRWKKPGDIAPVGRASAGSGFSSIITKSNLNNSSAARVNSSYIRLRNLYLSYSFPGSMLERWHMAKLRLYLESQNPLLFTSCREADPESVNNLSSIPVLRSYVFGIQCAF
jgi:TonB-linked SusC/RagA family outer membrane protein